MPIECPACKSTNTWKQRKIFRGKWIGCRSCGWESKLDDFHNKGGTHGIKSSNIHKGSRNQDWEQIDRLPEWAIKKMNRKRTNRVNGEHYIYKKDGHKSYKKKK